MNIFYSFACVCKKRWQQKSGSADKPMACENGFAKYSRCRLHQKKLQASYLSWIQTTAGLVTRITTPLWKVRIVQKIQMAIRTPLIVSRKILFKLRTTDWCALAAHHNPVVSSWHLFLISHWLTMVLPTNEKSDSLNKARAHQSVVLDLD